MRSLRNFALWLLCCFALPAAAWGTQALQLPGSTAETKPAEPGPTDPLGRSNPRSSILRFLQAAQSGDYKIAARYLQMPRGRSAAEAEQLAEELKVLMDRAYVGNLSRITESPEGSPQEGLPPDREQVGRLVVHDKDEELVVVRVNDPNYGPVWLISSTTLAKVPDLFDQVQIQQVETKLPVVLVQNAWLGMPAWQWLGLLLLIPIATGLSWALIQTVRISRSLMQSLSGKSPDYQFRKVVSGPGLLLLAVTLHSIGVRNLGLPLLHRHYYFQTAQVVFVFGLTWLTVRIVNWLSDRLRGRALLSGQTGTSSLLLLGQRMVKLLLIVVGALVALSGLGLNITTALAGLGIGGIAVALAAQKTLENLLGGVSILSDEVIRVGDVCRIGTTVGSVEDISLRSTRIRTAERIEVSIPNGALATMNVENLSRRDKILFQSTFTLRYETTADQLRFVLVEVRKLLSAHVKVEDETTRVRLVGFSPNGLDFEVVGYVKTIDFGEFAAVREDLLLRIMDIVVACGTAFALPSQTLYLTRDAGPDEAKARAVEDKVAEWRAAKEMPFPDLPVAETNRLRNTIEYPPSDSASRSNGANPQQAGLEFPNSGRNAKS